MSGAEDYGDEDKSAWVTVWDRNGDKSSSAMVYRDMLRALSDKWKDQPGCDWAVAVAAAYAGGSTIARVLDQDGDGSNDAFLATCLLFAHEMVEEQRLLVIVSSLSARGLKPSDHEQ